MRLSDVEAARELGLDARDLVRLVSGKPARRGVADVVVSLMGPLFAAIGIAARNQPTMSPTEFGRAADRLDEYAGTLAELVESSGDLVLTAHLDRARTWGARIWDDPRRESEAVLDELQPTIDRLVELRTQAILGRATGDGTGQPPVG